MILSKKVVLLINLGTPDSFEVGDVRRYLREFLMDPFVLDVAYPIRKLIVEAFILPKRPHRSAEAYESIWRDDGSPLMVYSVALQEKIQSKLDVPVALAMRYGNPSIASQLQKLFEQGVTELIVLPLYPHYADSSYGTAVEKVKSDLKHMRWNPALKIIPPFYKEPDYIQSLLKVSGPSLAATPDHILFSFHGVPERHLKKADPTQSHCLKCENCCEVKSVAHETCYRHHCFETVSAFMKASGLSIPHSTSFQSRLGRDPWLTPFTQDKVLELAQDGVKHLAVICPSFVSDCLETLEEIGMGIREEFLSHGGETFTLVPCLNEDESFVDFLVASISDVLN